MDPLKAEASSFHRRGSAGQRLLQALHLMRDGFALKRANLQRLHADDTAEQIDARLVTWMAGG